MKKLFKLLSLPLFAVFATSEIEASSTHSSLTIGSRYYSWDYWRGRFNYCSRFYLLQRNKRSNNYIYLKKLRLCLYLIYQVESYEFKCFFFINPFFNKTLMICNPIITISVIWFAYKTLCNTICIVAFIYTLWTKTNFDS